MQVKRRLNQLFGSIRRKEKFEEFEDSSEVDAKKPKRKKWKARKHSQNYSQWDLVENISPEPVQNEDELERPHNLFTGAILNEQSLQEEISGKESLIESGEEKKKSILQRSGSFIRRSIRRSKKAQKIAHDPLKNENLEEIVREVNQSLAEVANFGKNNSEVNSVEIEDSLDSAEDDFAIVNVQLELKSTEEDEPAKEDLTENLNKTSKFTLRRSLRRQASKLASKFQRNPAGTLRLKQSASVEDVNSFTSCVSPKREESSEVPPEGTQDLEGTSEGTGGFKRRMSFKKARKAMRKGVVSLGKNMVHASAVMPVSYECPPPTLYPDYESNYPSELERYYYRTVSYQPPIDRWDDERNLRYCRRPHEAHYYQHGFVYN